MTTSVRHGAQRHVVPIVASSAVSALATVAAPRLAGSPLLLIALAPRLPFLLLAAGRVPLVLFLLIGTARLCMTDAQHFALGRRFGPAVLEPVCGRFRLPAWCRPVRLPAGSGTLLAVFLRPVGRHLVLAGAGGASPMAVACADVAGTVAYLVAVFWVGDTIW